MIYLAVLAFAAYLILSAVFDLISLFIGRK